MAEGDGYLIRQAAELLDVSDNTIRNYMATGRLTVVAAPGPARIEAQSLDGERRRRVEALGGIWPGSEAQPASTSPTQPTAGDGRSTEISSLRLERDELKIEVRRLREDLASWLVIDGAKNDMLRQRILPTHPGDG